MTGQIRLVEFDWALITGQIGWKFTEITLYACLVEFGGHNLNGFTPNLTSQIQPVKFDRSNWVELGVNPLRLHCLLKALDYIVCLVKFDGHNLNDLHPIRPVEFDQLNWV